MKTLTKFVIFSFASLIIFTIVSQIVFVKTSVEMSSLTTCFFAAFGGEILTCALLKIFKLKDKNNDGNTDS